MFCSQDVYIRGKQVYGGCKSWNIGTKSNLEVRAISQRATNISLLTYDAYAQTSTRSSCDNAPAATAITTAILTATSSLSSISCAGQGMSHEWMTQLCVGGGVALCVDCNNPCATDQCPHLMSLNPCGPSSGSAYGCSFSNSTITGFRMLSGIFEQVSPPPIIASITYVAHKTALDLSVSLVDHAGSPSDGIVSCNAFPSGYVPSAVSAISAKNNAASSVGSVAEVHIDSLHPSSDYDVYCAAQSNLGTASSLVDIIATKTKVTTGCCKTITVTLLLVSLRRGTSSVHAVEILVDSPPSQSLSISLGSNSLAIPSADPVALIPSTTFITDLTTTSVFRYSLTAEATSALGLVQISTLLSGLSEHEYEIVYGTNSTFSIVNSEPRIPSLSNVIFSSDGTYMSAIFDSSTDTGSTGNSAFPCKFIFDFVGVEHSVCTWDSPSSMIIQIGSEATILPGDPVSTLGMNSMLWVRALCQPTVDPVECSKYGTMAEVTVPALPPLNALKPIVGISAPAVITRYDQYVLDLSSSGNGGGRPFKSVTFIVHSSANNSAAQYFLNHVFVLSPPTPAPAGTFITGSYSNIVITICNYFGKCTTGSQALTVSGSSSPIVIISGNHRLPVTTAAGLTLIGHAYSSNGTSSYDLTYSWKVTASNGEAKAIVSVAKQKLNFIVKPYSLTVGAAYTFTLTAYDSITLKSSTDSVYVTVVQGALVPSISGGTTVSMTAGSNTTLDASLSYDSDRFGEMAYHVASLYHAVLC